MAYGDPGVRTGVRTLPGEALTFIEFCLQVLLPALLRANGRATSRWLDIVNTDIDYRNFCINYNMDHKSNDSQGSLSGGGVQTRSRAASLGNSSLPWVEPTARNGMLLCVHVWRASRPRDRGLGTLSGHTATLAFEQAFETGRALPSLSSSSASKLFFQCFPPTHPSWCVGIRRATARRFRGLQFTPRASSIVYIVCVMCVVSMLVAAVG